MNKKRGIVLLVVLLVVLLLVMFSSGVLITVYNQIRSTRIYYERQASLKVAETGLAYAMARLSKDPCWQGCRTISTGVLQDFSYSRNGITVYEHALTTAGCVEGSLTMGTETGYFDLYFEAPGPSESLHFFTPDGLAGAIPATLACCLNNLTLAGGSLTSKTARNLKGESIPGKLVPGNTILIVCRGKVGNTSRTVEALMRISPDAAYDSVVIGDGNVSVTISGTRDYEQLVLGQTSDNSTRSSLMRATGFIALDEVSGSRNNYFFCSEGSGGRCESAPRVDSNLTDQGNIEQESDQDIHIPRLAMADVKPPSSQPMQSLSAGTYVFQPRADNETDPPSPLVQYYKFDDIEKYKKGEVDLSALTPEDISDDFLKKIRANEITWDPKTERLTFSESHSVSTSVVDGKELNNLLFLSGGRSRVKLQLGVSMNEEQGSGTTFFTNENENGSIYIGTQLTGQGTIMCTGNLDLQAESQLEADANSGISIYAGGSVQINEIPELSSLPEDPVEPDPPKTGGEEDEENAWEKLREACDEAKATGKEVMILQDDFTAAEQKMLYDYGFRFFRHDEDGQFYLGINDDEDKDKINNVICYPYDGTNPSDPKYKEFFQTYGIETLPGGKTDFKGRPVVYEDSIFRGLVYACQNFTVNSPRHSFILEGGLVAQGGNLNGNDTTTGGNVTINASDCSLLYDSKYLSLLTKLGNNQVEVLYWTLR